MQIEIEDLNASNLDDVCAIENASFSMPWRREDFEHLIESENSVYLVIRADSLVAGAAGYTDNGFEGYVNNVVVAEAFRGKGLGRRLMEELIRSAESKNVKDLTLEVRVSNTPAVKLYESLGFVSAGVRKNFYERPTEDAYVMWRH